MATTNGGTTATATNLSPARWDREMLRLTARAKGLHDQLGGVFTQIAALGARPAPAGKTGKATAGGAS